MPIMRRNRITPPKLKTFINRLTLRQTIAGILAIAMMSVLPAAAATADVSGYVGSASRPTGDGYWLVTSQGAVIGYGNAALFGDERGATLQKPIVGIASTPSGNGYWLVGADGGVFAFGDAKYFGSPSGSHLNRPIVGMASTLSGNGYWLVGSDGGVFAYGDATYRGSTGHMHLNKPVVGIAANADGNGYWLVASDGGVFSFGSSRFMGSTGNISLAKPVTAIAPSTNGGGYWLAGEDGGVFSFGNAKFLGSSVNKNSSRAIGVIRDRNGGYSIVRSDGSVDNKGAAGTANTTSTTAKRNTTTTGDTSTTAANTSTTAGSHTTTTARTATTARPATTVAPTPTTAASSSSPAGWTLKAQDDFNSFNSGNWSNYDGCCDPDGGQQRVAGNVTVANGEMDVNAHDNTVGGTCWCGNSVSDQTYGRWEIRARMDNGGGFGPAILLWPKSENWPEDGEIDIAEMSAPTRSQAFFTLHWGANNSQTQHSEKGDFSQWHTYGMEWESDHINYYLDGVLKYTNTTPAAIPHNPMHLAMQVDGAEGQMVPGQNVGLHVDWVKIYNP